MTILDKAKIGSPVKINLNLSKDRLTKETIEAINDSKNCVISDFKITDGKGIGVVIKLANGKEQWFFENEIDIFDEYGNIIIKENTNDDNKNILFNLLDNLSYKPKTKMRDLINPINFIIWLMVSIKDIL